MLALRMMVGQWPIAGAVFAAAFLACGSPVHAQNKADAIRVNAQRGAELGLFGGAAAGAEGGGASFGWSLGWRPSERVAIEGTGSWTTEPGIDGFAAVFGPRLYLNTIGRVAPFLAVDVGLFHASVDPAAVRATFYLDRLAPISAEKAFNDFVAAGGAGLDVHVRGRLWFRPDARVFAVVDGWRTHWFAMAGVHLTYRFTAPAVGP